MYGGSLLGTALKQQLGASLNYSKSSDLPAESELSPLLSRFLSEMIV